MSVAAEALEAHPSTESRGANMTLVDDRPLSPMVAEILERTKRSREGVGAFVGMVDSVATRTQVAQDLYGAGVYSSLKSASVRTYQITDMVNEVAIGYQGRPLIVREEGAVLAASPYLADDFVQLRRALLPDAPEVPARELVAEASRPIYDIMAEEGRQRTLHFARIADTANRFTGSDRLPKKTAYKFPQTPIHLALQGVIDYVDNGSGRRNVVPASNKELTAGQRYTTTHLAGAADRVERWFGEELFVHEISQRGSSSQIAGVRADVAGQVAERLDEVREFGQDPRIVIADRYVFWDTMGPTNDYLSGKLPNPPLPGDSLTRQALITFSAVDLLADARVSARRQAFLSTYGSYLRFVGIIDPEERTAAKKDTFSKSMKGKVTRDLSDGACNGLDPSLFFPEEGDSKATEMAKEVCERCVVRSECLDEALINNYKIGVWGGTSERERRRLRRLARKEAKLQEVQVSTKK